MLELAKITSNVNIGDKGPFDLYALDDFDFCENLRFDDTEGIYIFGRYYRSSDGTNKFELYYLGKTTDYDNRFYHHHKEKQLKKVNPNCIAIHACGKREMDKLEVDWIELWKPIYNIQHNS